MKSRQAQEEAAAAATDEVAAVSTVPAANAVTGVSNTLLQPTKAFVSQQPNNARRRGNNNESEMTAEELQKVEQERTEQVRAIKKRQEI